MKIFGISGKKNAGKDSMANCIMGIHLKNNGIIRGSFYITPDGQLFVSDIFGEENTDGILNQNRTSEERWNWWNSNIDPFIKLYSFADPLKQMCIEILGLTEDQCYGTNDQKNSLTKLNWKDMPGITYVPAKSMGGSGDREIFAPRKTNNMTAREVLQYIGTDIFRKMYHDVWVDATLRKMKIEQPEVAVVVDVRFPNEVEGIQKIGGKVIRLTRSPFKDEHDSETKLDKENFDWDNFDAIIDNAEMSIEQQSEAVLKCLCDLEE